MPVEAATRQQIEDNIERMRTLSKEGNTDGADALKAETGDLIRGLTGRGSVAAKRRYSEQMREAAAPPVLSSEVASLESKDISEIPEELFEEGAIKISEGVRQLMSNAELAREICRIQLDMHRHLRNKQGYPDIAGNSDAAKEANKRLYARAGELREGDEFDVQAALQKLIKSVHNQKRDVRAEYLRSLDSDKDEAGRYEQIIKESPKGTSPSAAVAAHYGLSLKGKLELQREQYHAGKDPAELITPEQRVGSVLLRLKRDIGAAAYDDFESLSEERKAEIRTDLEEMSKRLKTLIAAVV